MNEVGGHRIQAISKTDKHKRMQTSTITVAAFHEIEENKFAIKENDLDWKATRSGGNGGQSVNTCNSAIQLTHLPTKISVRCESERSQAQNKKIALDILRSKLYDLDISERKNSIAENRKKQVGSGQRGDKRRTIRYQDDKVVDHIDGRKWNLKKYLRGEW